jgi:O-antigen ligase
MILSLLLVGLIFIIMEFRNSRNKTQAVLISVLSVVLLAILYVNPVSRYRNIQEISATPFEVKSNQQYKNSIQIRLSLWWLAITSVDEKNFLLGSGTGDVLDVMKERGQQLAVSNTLNSYDPHNQYLFTLLSHGVVGLMILLMIFTLPVFITWPQRDYFYLIFLFFCASLCLTESAMELQKGIVFFSIINPLLLIRLNAFAPVERSIYTLNDAG